MDLKKEVLKRLLEAEGKKVSGEVLREEIGVSRMSIHNAIEALRVDGILIRSSTRSGYSLVSSDTLTSEYVEVLSELHDMKGFYFDEVDSTNNEAKRLLSAGERPPFLVIAKRQMGGRGRLGRSFFSPEGGLYFSLVINGNEIKDPDVLTLEAALATHDAILRLTHLNTKIKWVNDLYRRGKKVVGILTEGSMNLEDASFDAFIIGIGVNLTLTRKEIPPELKRIIGALSYDSPAPTGRMELALEIADILKTLRGTDYINRYRKLCFILGKRVWREKDGTLRPATALSVSEKGRLIIRFEDGIEEELSSGEVRIDINEIRGKENAR